MCCRDKFEPKKMCKFCLTVRWLIFLGVLGAGIYLGVGAAFSGS